MNCVLICVVLAVIGNVGSFVLNRTRRDLEQTIREVYGPPILSTSEDHASDVTSHADTKISVTEKADPQVPQGAETDAIRNIWPDFALPPPADPKSDGSINFEANETLHAEIQAEIEKLFGLPPSTSTTPPPDALIATESYPETNYTGPAFDSEDRFLPQSFIVAAHENSIDEETPKPTPKLRSLSPKDIITKTEINPSNEDHLQHQPKFRTIIIKDNFNSENNTPNQEYLKTSNKSNANNDIHIKSITENNATNEDHITKHNVTSKEHITTSAESSASSKDGASSLVIVTVTYISILTSL